MSLVADPWVGATLNKDRYEITRKLSDGGMAAIYLARDTNLKCQVVVKVPFAELLRQRGFAGRFTREIRSLVELSHPHIVRILDSGEHQGVPFAVMQYLPGGSLHERQTRSGESKRPMPVDTLATWLRGIADALDFIHRRRRRFLAVRWESSTRLHRRGRYGLRRWVRSCSSCSLSPWSFRFQWELRIERKSRRSRGPTR